MPTNVNVNDSDARLMITEKFPVFQCIAINAKLHFLCMLYASKFKIPIKRLILKWKICQILIY